MQSVCRALADQGIPYEEKQLHNMTFAVMVRGTKIALHPEGPDNYSSSWPRRSVSLKPTHICSLMVIMCCQCRASCLVQPACVCTQTTACHQENGSRLLQAPRDQKVDYHMRLSVQASGGDFGHAAHAAGSGLDSDPNSKA